MQRAFEIWQQHQNNQPGLYHSMTASPDEVDREVERLSKIFPGHRFYKRTAANQPKPRTV